MSDAASITVNVDWREEPPEEESRCLGCGDSIFLRLARLYLRVGRSSPWSKQRITLCMSCFDTIRK